MARILILEPAPEIRLLFERVVARLGHDPVFEAPACGDVDAVVLEPAATECVYAALAVREARPSLPFVCVSTLPASRETAVLDPHAYLLKPFPLADLERAVLSALQVGDARAVTSR